MSGSVSIHSMSVAAVIETTRLMQVSEQRRGQPARAFDWSEAAATWGGSPRTRDQVLVAGKIGGKTQSAYPILSLPNSGRR